MACTTGPAGQNEGLCVERLSLADPSSARACTISQPPPLASPSCPTCAPPAAAALPHLHPPHGGRDDSLPVCLPGRLHRLPGVVPHPHGRQPRHAGQGGWGAGGLGGLILKACGVLQLLSRPPLAGCLCPCLCLASGCRCGRSRSACAPTPPSGLTARCWGRCSTRGRWSRSCCATAHPRPWCPRWVRACVGGWVGGWVGVCVARASTRGSISPGQPTNPGTMPPARPGPLSLPLLAPPPRSPACLVTADGFQGLPPDPGV